MIGFVPLVLSEKDKVGELQLLDGETTLSATIRDRTFEDLVVEDASVMSWTQLKVEYARLKEQWDFINTYTTPPYKIENGVCKCASKDNGKVMFKTNMKYLPADIKKILTKLERDLGQDTGWI